LCNKITSYLYLFKNLKSYFQNITTTTCGARTKGAKFAATAIHSTHLFLNESKHENIWFGNLIWTWLRKYLDAVGGGEARLSEFRDTGIKHSMIQSQEFRPHFCTDDFCTWLNH
jgi:hypothetical protein